MLPRTSRPRRYQLKRRAAEALRAGHPWIFRQHLSSAAEVFADGQWLRLVDAENHTVGFGVFEREGAVAIRVLRTGQAPPDAEWLASRVERALARREALRRETTAFRVLHGESDGLPGVTLDVFGTVGVLQTYSAGTDALGRLAAASVRRALGLTGILWRPAARRQGAVPHPRVTSGTVPDLISTCEGSIAWSLSPRSGQKSGAFLDLRGLRRWLAGEDLRGQRVLNLFAYTGTLGLAAETAGATEIWQVDASSEALAFGAAHHTRDVAKHRWLTADVFRWLPELAPEERFDLIVVDPPQMTSRTEQVPRALAAYSRLYRELLPHLAPGGRLVACCCTSRIRPATFRATVERAVGERLVFTDRLRPEPDHPVRFPEADYLKVLLFSPRPPGAGPSPSLTKGAVDEGAETGAATEASDAAAPRAARAPANELH